MLSKAIPVLVITFSWLNTGDIVSARMYLDVCLPPPIPTPRGGGGRRPHTFYSRKKKFVASGVSFLRGAFWAPEKKKRSVWLDLHEAESSRVVFRFVALRYVSLIRFVSL